MSCLKKKATLLERSGNRELSSGVAIKKSRRDKVSQHDTSEGRALPAVPVAAAGVLLARGPRRRIQGYPAPAEVSSLGKCHGHPMDAFEDLLASFDSFIASSSNATTSKTRDGTQGYPRPHTHDINSNRVATRMDPITRIPPLNVTDETKEIQSRLPRLHYSPPPVPGATDASQTTKARRTQSFNRKAKPSLASATASPACWHSRRLESDSVADDLDLDPMDLMLRCKGRGGRPEVHGLSWNLDATGTGATPITSTLEGPEGVAPTTVMESFSGITAGVFRLSHAGTGFFYYGYSWDITAAKADQLRLLRRNGDETDCHPHRGLSAVIRRQRLDGGKSNGGIILFNVVRRVPLPPRFRVSDFEQTMREACAQELELRRTYLLVAMARQYQRKHICPAFRRMLADYRRQVKARKTAAATEIQRSWRGFCVRAMARLERQQNLEKVAAATAVAVWSQARQRAIKSRRRTAELRNVNTAKAVALAKCFSAAAAVTIQRWLRSSSIRHRKDEAAACSYEMILGTVDSDGSLAGVPTTDATLAGTVARVPSRPIGPSEVWMARNMSSTDTEASLFASDSQDEDVRIDKSRSPLGLSQQKDRNARCGHHKRQRPSSSREARNPPSTLRGDDPLKIVSSNGRQRQKVPSTGDPSRNFSGVPVLREEAPKFGEGASPRTRLLENDAQTVNNRSPPVVPAAPDASRLVLEGNPLFTAATTIQAAWRGFIARLGIRKRRRAEVALRRKREGKWRQQRGVVGKQVAVGWDKRRELEGGDGAPRDVHLSCVDIQRLWRGALGRMESRAIRQGRQDEWEASVPIQRIFRGAMGRQRARTVRAIRDNWIASAWLITRQGRRFVRRAKSRWRRRHLAALTIQHVAQRWIERHNARRQQIARREYDAARTVQLHSRAWIGRRQALQRKVLRRMGACALCCSKLSEMYFEATEQELCLACYKRTHTMFENRRMASALPDGAFEILVHRKRTRAATLTQRAWRRFQQRASAKYGPCEVCPRWQGLGTPRPRATRVVCIEGCDRRRHLRYCRRCSAISHSLRATAEHEIRGVDRYGTEIVAAATLGGAMWRYSLKLRFWRVFRAHRHTLYSKATLVQSRWRCYRCRSVFTALRRGFLYVEAAARSVERYWLVAISRDDVMAGIASFLAYSVETSPPGIYPAPSGRLARWESLVADTIRRRAAETVQLGWRNRMLRVVARASAEVARQDMMERRRLRALMEVHAGIDIQRVWRGSRGRSTAHRRATTIAFAQVLVSSYLSPAAFAIANLDAFNAHSGYIGYAGVDARSLLAAATGNDSEGSEVHPSSRTLVGSRAKRNDGHGALSLHLQQSGDGRGLSGTVAGISDVSVRVCLHRHTIGSQPSTATGSNLEQKSAGGVSNTLLGLRDTILTSRNDNENDDPPLTLKLELISVHYGNYSCRALADKQTGAAAAPSDLNVYRHSKNTPESSNDDSEGSRESPSCGRSTSSGGKSTYSSASRTATESTKGSTQEQMKQAGHVSDARRAPMQDDQYHCDVTWCGESIGGTRAPPTGLPFPRWEGQVFYLPLFALGNRSGTMAAVAATALEPPKSHTGDQADHVGRHSWVQGTVLGGGEGKGTADSVKAPPSPLVVTLGRLPADSLRGIGGRWPRGMTSHTALGGPKGGDKSDGAPVAAGDGKNQSSWLAFVSGLIEPVPVGRLRLEAGDVLSMLGSQQIVDVPTISTRQPVVRKGPSEGKSDASEEVKFLGRGGRKLRLLLSLEGGKRTRARLLVEDVLMSIMKDIMDTLPGKVTRIEVRVVGMRLLSTTASSVAKPRRIPALQFSATWNGDHAAAVDLLPGDGDTIDTSTFENYTAVHDDSGKCSLGRGLLRAVKARPRTVMLPMYVPFVMETPATMHPTGNCTGDPHDADCCAPETESAHIGRDIAGDSRFHERERDGGRSHCLRVTISANNAVAHRERLDGGGGVLDGDDAAAIMPSHHTSHPFMRQQAEAVFFERDLIRDNWTELLVPVSFENHSELISTEGHMSEEERENGNMSRQTRRHSKTHPRQRKDGAPSEVAVVLQARSAGFHPKKPPLWLLRRDFAEKTVNRILCAAAAAVAQPRVELTLVGLLGAVDSLFQASSLYVSGNDGSAASSQDNNRKRDEDHDEVLCQAFWNGTLLNGVRLRRAASISSSPPLLPLPEQATPCSGRKNSSSSEKGNRDEDGKITCTAVFPSSFVAATDGFPRHKDETERLSVTFDNEVNDRKNIDPATWFSDEPVANDNWVKLDGVPSSQPAVPGQTIHEQAPEALAAFETKIDAANGRRDLSPPLAWVPAENEEYGCRPFRFFLPACFSDNRETGTNSSGKEILRNSEDGNMGVEERAIRDNGAPACSLKDTNSAERATIRGNLRLVFWRVSQSPILNSVGPVDCGGGEEEERVEPVGLTKSRAMVVKNGLARPENKREEVRSLLGCAELVNDELVLQPPVTRVELPMLGSAGLDMSTAWATMNEPNRGVHGYGLTKASVAVVVRHYDVPRGPILNLRCPAPVLEVDIIDGHRLATASRQLSTNPYVVLTMNGIPFARSSTSCGTTSPVWWSETFRVKLPPPSPGVWHLTVQDYFRGYSGEACILGAQVYSQVFRGGSAQPTTSRQKLLRGGVGKDDVLLGEGRIPFSLLKSLPYHYLPLRLSPPTRAICTCPATTMPAWSGDGGNRYGNGFGEYCRICGSGVVCREDARADENASDGGLLGIGLEMVFPTPSIPELSPGPSRNGSDFVGSSRVPLTERDERSDVETVDRPRAQTELLLRIFEAEELISAAGPEKSVNPFCVVLVNGAEVGRTQTISNSPDPLWATDFRLSNEVARRSTPSSRRRGGERGTGDTRAGDLARNGQRRPSSPWGVVSNVICEVWDSVPEGKPEFLGAADLPTDFLSALLSPDAADDIRTPRGIPFSTKNRGDIERRGSHSLRLNLGPRNNKRRGVSPIVDDQRGSLGTTAVAGTATGAASEELCSRGVLFVSVETVDVPQTTTNAGDANGRRVVGTAMGGCGTPAASAINNGTWPGTGTEVTEAEMSKTSLRYRAAKAKTLAETTRGARARLDEARTMVRDAGSVPRGRSVDDCPRLNAERFVRAWQRETARAERAEALVARRSSNEFRQEILDQHAKGTKRSNSRATSADPPIHLRRTARSQTTILGAARKPTRERNSRSAVPEGNQLSPTEGTVDVSPRKQKKSADAGNTVADEPSAPSARLTGDVSPMPDRVKPLVGREIENNVSSRASVFGKKPEEAGGVCDDEERNRHASHEADEMAEDEKDEKGPSSLEKVLPPLPASQREVFLHVHAISGLAQPFVAKRNTLSARVFWGGQEVGCTRSTEPRPESAPVGSATSVATAAVGDSGTVLDGVSLVDKVRDSAASAVGSVIHSAATVAITAGGGTAEGQWNGETFVLPLPEDGEQDCLMRDGDEEGSMPQQTERAKGGGARDVDGVDSGSCASGDDGVHLRVEVWQGKHCHGQVELEGVELLRMCKKVQNAAPDGWAEYIVDCGNGDVRLPNHFPHFLPSPEAIIPYKLLLVPREGDANRSDSASAPRARLAVTLLILEPGQAEAAQAQLAVALEVMESHNLRQQEIEGNDCPSLRPDVRNGGGKSRGASAEETGIAEALLKTLNARRTPLAFRLEPLMLHLNTVDSNSDNWPGEKKGSTLVLAARREVIVSRPLRRRPAVRVSSDADHITSGASAAVVAGTEASEGSDCALPDRHQDGVKGEEKAETVVIEEEELGRSLPFTVRSATAILSRTSFEIPSNALVADDRRRQMSRAGGAPMSTGCGVDGRREDERGAESSSVRIVVDLTRAGDNSDGSSHFGGMKTPIALGVRKRSDFPVGEGEGGSGSGGRVVVARAVLDPAFLRRTIGCQRSVVMMPIATAWGGKSQQKEENGEQPPHFARLCVAGHVVSVRPGQPRLRLDIMECQNLRAADVLGKSDPCVVLFWNGTEVGRTPIALDDLNPTFSAPGSVFQLPLKPAIRMLSGQSSQTLPSTGGRSSLQGSADWQAYAPELRLEVWDMDRGILNRNWKKGELLGAVTLRGPHGIVPVLQASTREKLGGATTTSTGVMLMLRAEVGQSKRGSQTLGSTARDSAGVISVKLELENATDETDAWEARAAPTPSVAVRGKSTSGTLSKALDSGACPSLQGNISEVPTTHLDQLGVRCLDARGLPAGCDAYCRVFWNGRQVGKTLPASVVALNMHGGAASSNSSPALTLQRNPVWSSPASLVTSDELDSSKALLGAAFTARVPLYEAAEGDELTVEAFDASRRRKGTINGIGIDGVGASRKGSTSHPDHDSSGRDVVGRPLGRITIRGEHLLCPPWGRIDLPLSPASSSAGHTLGIALERLPNEEPGVRALSACSCSETLEHEPRQRPKRWLRLLLEEARLLRGLDVSGTSDPFVSVYVDRVWYRDTRVCWSTLAPRWEQWMEIEIRPGVLAVDTGWGHEIRLEVWDKDRIGSDDFIGEVILYVYENHQGIVEVLTSPRLEPTQRNEQANADHGREDRRGVLQHHSLELCREGEKEAPRQGGGGMGGSIGRLTCSTLAYTENNWRAEVENMNLTWALGAHTTSSDALLVVQLVGMVRAGKEGPPPPPSSYQAPVCFALLKWNKTVVGRTTCCRVLHEPTWPAQTFALQTGQSACADMLCIEIYYTDEAGGHASDKDRTEMPTPFCLVARCQLEGPFLAESFTDYTGKYPLLYAKEESTYRKRVTRTSVAADWSTTDKENVTAADPKSFAAREERGAQSAALVSPTPNPDGNRGDDRPTMGGRFSKKYGVTVGFLNLRASVTAAAADACEGAAIGDEDAPEIRRRRTNRVSRRLRLWVRWVSLAHLLGSFSVSPEKSELDVQEPAVGENVAGSGDSVQQRPPNLANSNSTNNGDSENTVSATCMVPPPDRILSPHPTTSGVACRITWCGVQLASFQLCPRSGLPITPGECLLKLPRGMRWSSCILVLEVVSKEEHKENFGVDRDSEHLPRSNRSRQNDGGQGERESWNGTGETGGLPRTGYRKHHRLLGTVAVGWQALTSLQERDFRFKTCPEEVVPACGAQQAEGGRGGYFDLECSLCLPTTAVRRQSTCEVEAAGRGGYAFDDFVISTPNTKHGEQLADATTREATCSETWRVLPARLAMSIRLERLEASRPPRPLRLPPVAPTTSVCRLRLGFVGNGASIRASHPGFIWPRRSLLPPTTIVVGWNGYEDKVGPTSQWKVKVSSDDDEGTALPSGLGDDIILPLPRDGRERLVLTLALEAYAVGAAAPTQFARSAHAEAGTTMLGTASIDWDGLSCLPLHVTDYFVDTPVGRSPTNEHLLRPIAVDLELVAPDRSTTTRADAALSEVNSRTSINADNDGGVTDKKRIIGGGGTDGATPVVVKHSCAPDTDKCKQLQSRISSGSSVTAGFGFRLTLRLEQSPVFVPHVLSLSPVAAGTPAMYDSPSSVASAAATVTAGTILGTSVALGDFRNPYRRERLPYLRFSCPWDEWWLSVIERRASLVSRRPWTVGFQRAVTWSKTNGVALKNDATKTGTVAIRLPLLLSGFDGSVVWPGSQKLQGDDVDAEIIESVTEGEGFREGGESRTRAQRQQPLPVLLVEAYDMGNYSPPEHQAAQKLQRLWRRKLEALRSARLWWEWDADVRRYYAAVCVQANYRGWKGRQSAILFRVDAARRSAAAAVIQRRWRCSRARRRAEVLRTEGLRELRKLQQWEQECEARRLESRRAGLSVLVAKGAGLRGMDISGLSDPFCVVMWNGKEVGRTAVRFGTRDPDWEGDDTNGGFSSVGAGWFDLPFHVPETEKWGSEAWPPMHLEIRCYDQDIMGTVELIGRVALGADALLPMVHTAPNAGRDGGSEGNFGRAAEALRGVGMPVTVPWLELMPDDDDTHNRRKTSSGAAASRKARNPFESLGDIAVAVSARLPLPVSVEEYERSTREEGFSMSRFVADAGVRAVLQDFQQAFCLRDRGLWVVNASNLRKADVFGKSDPYAKVFWDGREVGTTAVRRKTLNPVWFEKKNRENKAAPSSSSGKADEEKPYFWLESSRSTNPRLRVEVYDWDAVSSHDFLGGVDFDVWELADLQKVTLDKARAHGGDMDQQMLFKTEFPLRSRENKAGGNGTVGLCVYVDLEQQKIRQRREQAAAARRQQGIDLAIAEADSRKQALECTHMAAEDSDAPDSQQQSQLQQQQQGPLSSWQMFYDESVDPHAPWWFNSITGESTWECPAVEEPEAISKEGDRSPLELAADDPGATTELEQQIVVQGGEGGGESTEEWQMYYDYESADEPIPWWFNSATGESAWECPVTMDTGRNAEESAFAGGEIDHQQRNEELIVAASGGDDGGGGGGFAAPWTQHWSEEHQAFFYSNEETQESTWDPPAPPYYTEEPPGMPQYTLRGEREKSTALTATGPYDQPGQQLALAPGTVMSNYGVEDITYTTDVSEGPTAIVSAKPDPLSSGFPFYVNERGNRVFAVPRSSAPPSRDVPTNRP